MRDRPVERAATCRRGKVLKPERWVDIQKILSETRNEKEEASFRHTSVSSDGREKRGALLSVRECCGYRIHVKEKRK